MVKRVCTNTAWVFARNTNSLFKRSVFGKPAGSEQRESLFLRNASGHVQSCLHLRPLVLEPGSGRGVLGELEELEGGRSGAAGADLRHGEVNQKEIDSPLPSLMYRWFLIQ